MVPAHSYEIPRVSYYSGYYHVGSFFAYQTFTIYGLLFQVILLNLPNQLCSPNPKSITTSGLASSSFARHYSRNRFFFLFLQVLRCFSSLRSPQTNYFTHSQITNLFTLVGFPHSEISGSKDICSYPKLIAAYHVFLRLLVPSHSPYALSSLTFKLSFAQFDPHFNDFLRKSSKLRVFMLLSLQIYGLQTFSACSV